jgi:hypothetical protein
MPRQIHQVVLGRSPASVEQAVPPPDYDPSMHFRKALLSREFRKHFLGAFLKAYPTKGRDVFIHVPKCAGTDLILNLGRRLLPLPKMLEVDGWTDDVEFLEIVAGLARAAMTSERFFVYGHMELGIYANVAGVRLDDRIFTVLRDPIDMMVSQANYVIGRLRQDPTGREPDAAEYLQLLGRTHLPEDLSVGELKDMTLKALLNPAIAEPNRASFYLGDGSGTTFAKALENLIVHDVEITTTVHYDRWLKERWGIGKSDRHNRSEPVLANAEARRLCGATLAASTQEDRRLYDIVSWTLLQTGAASVTGQQIARLAGPPLVEALGANRCPPLPVEPNQARAETKILVAQGVKHVEMCLAEVSVALPGTVPVETVFTAGFGAGGGGERYRLEGWANPEPAFTWTAGEQSTVQLPALGGEGSFVVRMVISPFVVKQRLPVQRVELLIGGVRIGACEVKDIAVIEAEVPAELLGDDNRLTLTLRLPTATRPNELTDSKDDRQLALAVRSLTVLRLPAAA